VFRVATGYQAWLQPSDESEKILSGANIFFSAGCLIWIRVKTIKPPHDKHGRFNAKKYQFWSMPTCFQAILWNRRPTTPVSTETGRQTGAPKQLPVRKDWRSSAVVKKLWHWKDLSEIKVYPKVAILMMNMMMTIHWNGESVSTARTARHGGCQFWIMRPSFVSISYRFLLGFYRVSSPFPGRCLQRQAPFRPRTVPGTKSASATSPPKARRKAPAEEVFRPPRLLPRPQRLGLCGILGVLRDGSWVTHGGF